MSVWFPLIEKMDDRLQAIIKRVWLEQFGTFDEVTTGKGQRILLFEKCNVDYMIQSFRDCNSPVDAMDWHAKFFVAPPSRGSWFISDQTLWAERVELEWSRGLSGSDEFDLTEL